MPRISKHAVSPDICSSKVILFLGAGASVPLGLPVMGPFMDLLEEDIGNEDVRATLVNMYRGDPASRDLEVLFETFAEYRRLSSRAKDDANFHPLFHQGKLDNLVNRVNGIRRHCEDLVLRTYASVDTEKVVALHGRLMGLLAGVEDAPRLVVFTTNYDTAIEDLVDAAPNEFELVDGFTPGSTRIWQPETMFDLYRPNTDSGKRELLLFKLHGSSTWYRRRSSGQIVKQGGLFLRLTGNPDYENSLVWPGPTKVVPSGPYETNYAYLQGCLDQAQYCVVVGFSFRDDVIRRYIVESFGSNRLLNLVIIDPNAKDIVENILKIPHEKRIETSAPEIPKINNPKYQFACAVPSEFSTQQLPEIVQTLMRLGLPLKA